ncbi:hypothetical protein TWF225_010316 [Orbilia oligospora]|uniref:Uncharacterized protein n=1 Tax=Orbilia oligospora TaxID=2813651 RepID=A0A7C8K3T6_ORBOL|nr:hypothetical protein TWF751_011856 [Orbilia oligospora]KAF3172569.1 hypothetical protein TWF225_010316 [Orbilia oligospora]KAF3237014.1 hypothetical protein TWF128_001229 [Orbilia oligospora]KAF3251614.1 hypothetical protein TWF217_007953 [Orbilia oligospora]KAF3277618.1 hypothetical protein TWF132_001431 [Orbilia oligospora]
MSVPTSALEEAFSDAPLLRQEILEHVSKNPQYLDLFHQISRYIIKIQQVSIEDRDGPSIKRRKLENNTGSQIEVFSKSTLLAELGSQPALLRIPDISFSIPQRKKFALVLTATALGAFGPNESVEFGVHLNEIDYVACVPVPEKAARQWNFAVFAKNSHGITDTATDPLLFTVTDTPPKGGASGESTDIKQTIIDNLNRILPINVMQPSPEVFRSLTVNSYRKNENSYHVKSHLGTKEGFLFFLEDAIIWGFKKPLFCFAFDSIESSSYSSITQRTFSLTIKTTAEFSSKEIEFSMIDQVEHPAIDDFLRRNQLKDASMAETKRAKIPSSLIKENTGAKSELQAAENEIAGIDQNDSDDEDDDDYEQHSDGSDLTGESDSDDSDAGLNISQRTSSRNLAEEELGSELEDVDVTDDEEP